MKDQAQKLVKARTGISTSIRDEYITSIIEGVISELEDVQGLSLDKDSPHQLMFIVDYATWRYENRGEAGGMPRHLQLRLHNLIISGGADDV